MPKRSPLSTTELRILLTKARLLHRQPELDIRYRKTSRPSGRLLVITPRRIGTAPKRNLIRRRLKALFYEERLFEHGYDVVIYCRKGSTDLSFQQLKEIILNHFPPQATSTN